MRAIVYEGPGKLVLKDVPQPRISHPGQVLIKVSYTGICGTDLVVWQGGLTRVIPPVILGHEFVGVVIDSSGGDEVAVGDKVAVEPLISCGQCLPCRSGNYHVCRNLRLQGVDVDGGFTSYVLAPAAKVYKLAQSLSLKEAAFVEPLAVAIHMVRRAKMEAGDYVVVLGAGPIGMLVAMVCRELAAKKVVLAEVNPFRIKLAQEYGFSIINPTKDNLKEKVLDETNSEGADVTFELAGHPDTAAVMTDITRIRGTILQGSVFKQPPQIQLQHITFKEIQMLGSRVYNSQDYMVAIDFLEKGRINVKPLISTVIPLEEAIIKGFIAIKNGEPLMKVLVKPDGYEEGKE